ncbi:hypothetical protein, partial [Aquabacterium sp.]|uniref:hypothetical protein n=1 Tax=Aquabacterium sp. TaxID=1872578 RepID=UPI002BEC6564
MSARRWRRGCADGSSVIGPLRPFGCCSESRHSIVESCGVAGIPPRRAGNFFLLAQKEVTKKESQKTKRSFVPP